MARILLPPAQNFPVLSDPSLPAAHCCFPLSPAKAAAGFNQHTGAERCFMHLHCFPVDLYDVRPCLVLADVSHRNNDRETGEFCSHEGRHWHLPAAPSTSPLQLPISTSHVIGSHPAQGQGALHLQVRAWAPQRGEAVPAAPYSIPGRTSPSWSIRQQRAAEQPHMDISAVLAGVGGKTGSSRIKTEHSDD